MFQLLFQAPAEEKPLNPIGAILVFGGLAVALLWMAWKKYKNGGDSK